MKWHLLKALGILIYLFAAFATYGYVEARRNPKEGEAFGSGAIWPAYWFARGFIAAGDFSVSCFTPSKVKVEAP